MENVNLEGNIDVPPQPSPQNLTKRIMSISLSNASAREWFMKTRQSVQPWSEFVNTSKFKIPKTLSPIPKRLVKNIEHFQGNYLFVFLGLVVFCILTSPLLLVAIAACLGACYILSLKNQSQKITILGREVSLTQQYMGVATLSFPLFWLAGAGSVVFWIIGASFFVVIVHASMYLTAEEAEEIELIDMEEVQIV
ncbi:prenylated Rab acceptor protein 1-like isoform X2 [Gigantopelta aegis]|uniref:prenylated Rab acceptor protein 1-like isoform X2 n=1 Tax=Gigantopelta aegis TaxID=1735272 RepID=UPI001B887FCA|nr:prenylated Rab acceptor protein 1-like isoform X2 [Gigantopelta aegis]